MASFNKERAVSQRTSSFLAQHRALMCSDKSPTTHDERSNIVSMVPEKYKQQEQLVNTPLACYYNYTTELLEQGSHLKLATSVAFTAAATTPTRTTAVRHVDETLGWFALQGQQHSYHKSSNTHAHTHSQKHTHKRRHITHVRTIQQHRTENAQTTALNKSQTLGHHPSKWTDHRQFRTGDKPANNGRSSVSTKKNVIAVLALDATWGVGCHSVAFTPHPSDRSSRPSPSWPCLRSARYSCNICKSRSLTDEI